MKTLTLTAIGAAVILAGILGFQAFSKDPADTAAQGADEGKPAAAGKPAGGGRSAGRGRPAPLVVASDVTDILINDRLKAVGNGTAQTSVSVVPLSGGILTEVLVSAGQRVEADAILAKLDDDEQQIARDRAAREASEAEADAARLELLYNSRTTSQVERNRARAALSDAQLALRDTELKLARRTITAPIAGIVGFVSSDTGNYINAQTELLTIDNRLELEVEFWVPERFANQISLDQAVNATALADPGTQYEGTISGIGSRIERDSRTLPVRARIKNQDDQLRPGMSFELQLSFPGQSFPAVDPLAIQWDSGGSFVWQIVDNKVQRVAARIIQRNPESVLIDASLQPGDQIASEGVLALRQGAEVRIDGALQRPAGDASDKLRQTEKPSSDTSASGS